MGAVIPARNEGHWVAKTIDSLLASGAPIEEIVVVDDGSTDGGCDGLGDIHPHLRVIHHEESKGIAAARNAGIAALSPDIDVFLVLDAHMKVHAQSVELMAEYAMQHQGIVCASVYGLENLNCRNGARFLYMRDQYVGYRYGFVGDEEQRLARLESFGGKAERLTEQQPRMCCLCGGWMHPGEEALKLSGHMYRHSNVCAHVLPDETLVSQIEHITGAFYAIPRTVWEKLGSAWYNTAGPWGHSEVSISIAAYFLGIPLYCDRRAIVGHRYGSIGYTLDAHSQWRNAARSYYIMFGEETFKNYWEPILTKELSPRVVDAACADAEVQRDFFQANKIHSDEDFFVEMMKAPVIPNRGIPNVSVIIPSCNEGEEITKTVRSIQDSQPIWCPEIIVVDDKSTDKSCEYGRRKLPQPTKRREGCTILKPAERQGVSGSRNYGASLSKNADVFVFTDGHTRWEPDGMRKLVQAAVDEDALVAAAFYNFKGDTPPPLEERKLAYGGHLVVRKKRGLGNGYNRQEPDAIVSEVPTIIGSSYAVTRAVFDAMGGWIIIPGRLWGYAETEWALRSYFTDRKLFVRKDVIVGHRLRDDAQFPYEISHESVLRGAYFVHKAFFSSEVYESLWKPILATFGLPPIAPDFQKCVNSWRVYMKHASKKSEADFFREMLPGQYPDREQETTFSPEVEDAGVATAPTKTLPVPPPAAPEAVGANGVVIACCCPTTGFKSYIRDPNGIWYEMLAYQEKDQIRVVSARGVIACAECATLLQNAPTRPAKGGLPVHFENHRLALERQAWQ